uniref:Uncharacterized protein n=1 Tax=Chromera velia CCMP2878 TaxID=1169474 RepID=A0A0G4H8I4_9ALVE|eukprot:Cvel_25162.t1-p1 / transcript=Cvel_25162.t1 / gene=Cvel_25162 / organism=Chromera_velia_CCMP2878 / gene_product=hypothetical protein / transcript_product=hypothetical protein / location=Cvel_scaffold2815:16095-16904(-) / protein_length=76 / sequence_SO=supercontig / SO=protein_coding / is_pseudo=false
MADSEQETKSRLVSGASSFPSKFRAKIEELTDHQGDAQKYVHEFQKTHSQMVSKANLETAEKLCTEGLQFLREKRV